MNAPELRRSVSQASKWAFLSELVAKVLTPCIFLALVRFLAPEDFGIAAAAVMVVTFTQLLWDAGLGKALIQSDAPVDDVACVVFWSNVGLSLIVYGVLYVAADAAAAALGDPRISQVLRVQGLQGPIMALAAVQRAILQRHFLFRRLFWVRLCATGVPGLASLPLAWMGLGYWALVAGTLAGTAAEAAVLWSLSDWRPSLKYPLHIARKVGRFGILVLGEGLLTWGIAWGDAFVVSRQLGSEALGFYRGGGTVVSMTFSLAVGPLVPLLFSTLSRLQRDDDSFRRVYLEAVYVFALVALPLGAMLFAISREIVLIAFGAKWLPTIAIVSILGALQGISWIAAASPEAYRAKGRPDINLKVNVVTLCYYLPLFWWAAHGGMEKFLSARFAAAMVAFAIHMIIATRMLQLQITAIAREIRWVVLGVAGQLVTMSLVRGFFRSDFSPWLAGPAIGGAGALVLLICLWPDRRRILRLVQGILHR